MTRPQLKSRLQFIRNQSSTNGVAPAATSCRTHSIIRSRLNSWKVSGLHFSQCSRLEKNTSAATRSFKTCRGMRSSVAWLIEEHKTLNLKCFWSLWDLLTLVTLSKKFFLDKLGGSCSNVLPIYKYFINLLATVGVGRAFAGEFNDFRECHKGEHTAGPLSSDSVHRRVPKVLQVCRSRGSRCNFSLLHSMLVIWLKNSENTFPKNLYWEISPHSSLLFPLVSTISINSIQIPIKKYIIPSCIQLSSRRVGASLNHPFVSSPLLCEPPQSEFSLRREIYVRAIIVIIRASLTATRTTIWGERKLCIRYYWSWLYWFYIVIAIIHTTFLPSFFDDALHSFHYWRIMFYYWIKSRLNTKKFRMIEKKEIYLFFCYWKVCLSISLRRSIPAAKEKLNNFLFSDDDDNNSLWCSTNICIRWNEK